MKCPNCGAEDQTGKFCAACGAALDATCPSCGAAVPAGASYCTACGKPVGAEVGGAGAGSSLAPWVIGALSLAIVAVLVVFYLPDGSEPGPPTGATQAPFMGGEGGAPGGTGLSADMRTNADRLFNRIMTAAEQGNEAEVAQFMPMAIQAYEMVEGLDNDGLFHLALLHLTAESPDPALATADRILADNPDHLLGLAVAAQAAEAAGQEAQATGYWQRFLDAYETEAAKPLPEYVDHQPILPEYRAMAREATEQ